MQSTSVALPLLQGLVTILALCTVPFADADVSHVLRGEARPPPHNAAPDPREVNSLTADAGDYWWMADNSPLRAAYDDYKDCTKKGNCGSLRGANANLPPIDIKKNPFFNGAIQSNSISSGQGSKNGHDGHAFHSGASIDISKNPFLNGEFVAGNGDKVWDANGFIGVQPKKPGFATIHPLASNKPGFSTSFPVGQQAIVLNGSSSGFGSGNSGFGGAASFAIARGQAQDGLQHSKQGPSQPAFGQASRSGGGPVACTVKNHGCVPKQLCVNGVVTGNTENLLLGLYCNPDTEVCCQLPSQGNLNDLSPKLSGKTAHPTSINDLISSEKKLSSGSSIKFAGANGSSPITIQVVGGENDNGKTQYTSGSSVQASTLKPTREVNSNENSVFGSPIDYSNVHFDSNVRFASTIQGPEYLPPLEGTTPSISTYQPSIPTTPRPVSCPPGTQRTLGGLCESTQLPECPPGTIRKPDNSCEKPACPYGYEQQPDGSCRRLQPPTTPQSPTTPSCPPGTYPIGGGRCTSPSTSVTSCPPGTLRRPDGSCGPRTGPTPTPCPPGTHLTSLGECAPDTQQTVCPFGAVRLPDGTCQNPSSPRPCPPGTFLTASGACSTSSTPSTPAPSCPPGTIQQPDGSCQRRITTLPTCPPGTFRGPSGECRAQPTPLPGCPIGSTRQPDGSCQRSCPSGSYPGPNGECRGPSTPSPAPRCPAGTIQQPDGSCQRPSSPSPTCRPGSYPGPNGECRAPSTPSPAPRCPAGTIQQPDGSCQRPSSPSPTCPPGSYTGPNGECRAPSTPPPSSRCPAGTTRQPDGSCQRPQLPCPPGTYQGQDGECKRRTTPSPRCPIGTIQQPDGSCQRPSTSVSTCPPGSYPGPNGECRRPTTPAPAPVCPFGTIQQPDGSCQRPISPTSCPPNTYLGPSGSCEPARAITTTGPPAYEYPRPCPPGTVKTASGACEVPTSSPRPACPTGTRSTPFGTCEPIFSATTPKPPPRPFERPTTPELNKDYLPPKPTTQYVPSVTTHKPHQTSTTTEHRTSFTSSTQHPPFSTPRPFTAFTKPSCRQGQILSSNGVCIYPQTSAKTPATRSCPPGTKLSPFTDECVKSPSGFTTGYEYQKPTTPVQPTASTRPQCGPGQVLSPSGICTYSSQVTKPTCKPGEIVSSSGDCLYQKTFEPSTSKPSCPTGQVPSASGFGCEYPRVSTQIPSCPPDTKLNPFTRQCDKTPEASTGYEYPRPTTPSKPQCGPGETLSPSGNCIPIKPYGPSPTSKSCRSGQVLSISGECVYPASSTPRPPFGLTTAKPCPPGQVSSVSGFGCEYPRTPVPSCPPGTQLSPFTKGCVKIPGAPTSYEFQTSTTATADRPKPTLQPGAQCGPGQSLSPTGQCITISASTPRPSCGPGRVLSASGTCVYQSATAARPTFRPPTSRPSCPLGKVPSPSGSGCEYPKGPTPEQSCPPGTRLSSSNKCEKTPRVTPGYEYPKPSTTFTEQPRPTVSPRPQCGPGQSLSPSGQCVFPSRPGSPTTGPSIPELCPSGQVPSASGYGCEYPKVSTPLPSCPSGTKLNRFTKQCDKTGEASTGYEYPRPTTPSKPKCGPGETLSPSGNCVPIKPYGPASTPKPSCRFGQVMSASGECVYPESSTPRPPFGPTTAKPCPPGQVPSAFGFGCEYPRTPVPSCPLGTKLSPVTKECVKIPVTPTGSEYQTPTTASAERPKPTLKPGAQCGPGQSLSPTGQCITVSASTPRPSCGPGQVLSASGTCVYQTATAARPTFGPSTSRLSCPLGQVLSLSGSGCEYPKGPAPAQSCPPGTRLSSFSNKCEKTPRVTPGYEYPKPSTPFTEQPRPTVSPRPQCGPGQSLSPSGQCVSPSRPGPSTTGPSISKLCPTGQVPSASGYGCEYPKVSTPLPSCPPGTKLNRFTKQCDKTGETSTGYEYPRPTTPSKLTCGPGETLSPSGNCIPIKPYGPSSTSRPACRFGQVLSASGECIYPASSISSTPRPPFGPTTTKSCPPGQVPSTSGLGCEYPRTPAPSCPLGTRLSPFTKECVQVPGTPTGYENATPTTATTERPRPIVTPGAQCGLGKSLTPTGHCITVSASTPRPSCGPGQVLSASGTCVYQTATTTRPTFEPPTSRPSCPLGQVLSLSGSGCEYPKGPAPAQSCPPGTRLSSFSNKCEKIPKVTPGYEYPKPSTTFTEQPRPTVSPRPQCGPGQSLSPSGQCVFPSRPGSPTTGPSIPELCPSGQIPSASGYGCEYPKVSTPLPSCPSGTKLNRFTKQCDKTGEASTGYEYPRPTTPSKPKCGPRETLSPSGNCVPIKPYGPSSTPKPSCRFGQVMSASGECVYPASSTPRPPFGPTTAKPCPPGQVPSASGFGCEYARTPVSSCPLGTKISPFTKECVKIPGTPTGYEYQTPTTASAERPKPTLKPGAQCGPGKSLSPTGQCITVSASTARPSCGPGQVLSASGTCLYQSATTARRTFGPSTSRPSCPLGLVPSPSGSGCEYPKGSAPAQSCPPGTRLSSFSNKCEKTPRVTPGYEYPKPSTTFTEQPRPTVSPRPQCGPGQSLSPSGQCVFPSRPGSSTTGPSIPELCPTGQVPSASGYGCEYPKASTPLPSCPPGTKLNRFTKQCDKTGETSTGYEYPRPTTPSKPKCGPGETLSPSGNCIPIKPYGPSSTFRPACRFGQVLSASGECINPASSTSSTPRPPFGPTTTKPCPPGQVPSTSGIGCEYPRTPAPSCPLGTRLSPFTKECVQVPGTPTGYENVTPATATAERPRPIVTPGAQCSPGQSLSPTGQCITVSASTPRPSCGPGQVLSAPGTCVYQSAITARPTFGPSTSRPSCPLGLVPSPSGSGCEYPKGPAPAQSCPPGTRLSSFSNKCEKTPRVTPGYEYPKPSTPLTEQPRPTVSPRPQCGPGQSLSPSGQCVFPSRPGSSTTGPSIPELCPTGQVPSASGYGCEYPKVSTPLPSCPPGTKLNRFTKQCDKTGETSTGYEYPRPTTPSKPKCGPGETLSLSGNCILIKPYGPSSTSRPACRFGQVLSASGECIYPASSTSSTPRPPFGPTTTKPCPPGQVPSTSGLGCEYPRTPVPSCPPGTRLSPFTKECVQVTGTPTGYENVTPTTATDERPRPIVTPGAQCGPGQSLSPTGQCITVSASTARPTCGPGQVLSASGTCVYQSATTARPTFGPSTSRPSCPLGQVPSLSGSGCEYPKGPTPEQSCPPGTRLSTFSNKCEKSHRVTPGYEYPKPSTPFTEQSRPTVSPRPQCGPGQSLSPSGQCVFPSRPGSPTTGPSIPKLCPTGQVPSASGYGCEYPKVSTPPPSCPPGTKLNRFTKQCDTDLETSTGYEYPRPATPSKPQCGPGETLSPSGNCVPMKPYGPSSTPKPSCRFGQVISASGECVYRASSTTRPPFGPITAKPCPPGQVPSISGFGCEYPRTPVPSCPPGTRLSPSTKECVQAPGTSAGYEYSTPTTATFERPKSPVTQIAQCGPGQSLSSTGKCITISVSTPRPSTLGTQCGPGESLSPSGQCVTPSGVKSTPSSTPVGYQYPKPTTPFPAITRPTSSQRCGQGQVLSPSGRCVTLVEPYRPAQPSSTVKPSCAPGQIVSDSGICAYPAKPSVGSSTPRVCPAGQVPSDSGCEYLSKPTTYRPSVSTGYEYQRPSTSYSPELVQPTSKPQCAPGESLSPSGQCVTRSKSRPSYGPSTPKTCPPGQIPSTSSIGCEYPRESLPTTFRPTGYEYKIPTKFTPIHPQSPSRPPCNPGESLSPSGQCVTPSGATRPTYGSSTPKPCPPGQIPSTSGFGCVYPNGPTTLRPSFGPSTAKPCPSGQIRSESGIGCAYPKVGRPTYFPGPTTPLPGRQQPTVTSKPCPPGQVPSFSGVGCEYPRVSGPTTYRPGISTGYQYPKPTQPFQEPLKPTSPSLCGPGQTVSASGLCVYPSGPSACSPGQTLSPSGECVDRSISTYRPSTSKPSCPPGKIPSASGVGCEYPGGVTPSRPFACKPGQTLSPSGVCLDQTISTYKPSFGSPCPPGQVPSASGVGCEYPQGPSQGPSVCPPGQILSSSGSCIPVSQKPCPPGQTRSSSGICVQTTHHPHTVNHFTTTSPKARPTAKPSGGYNYETPTPAFGYPSSPLDSSQNNINSQYDRPTSTPRYTPQKPGPSESPDNTVDSANANSFFVPTTRQPVTVPQQTYSRQPTFNGGQQTIEETSPPVGCAAALKCVQEIYCTADGFVSPVPVVLTKEQELLRVPTTTCKDIETGIIGKCCRDPNYKDPWPSANLVNGVDDGQYKEDNFYGQRELVSNRLTRASNLTGAPVIPPALRKSRTQEASNSGVNCGTRNLDSSPKGESPLDANFAEYPWQAMILRDSNRSLLCGGVIIRDNAILTSAHCVEGLDTNDVLAKGGEWKLGIDEEPLPFQIVKVGAIIRHPEYKPGSYHNDVAILVLREKLRFTKNIGPLCLSQTKQILPNGKCKLTGWGKRILQLHAKGAIMHHIDVNVIDNQKCHEQLSEKFKESLPNYSPNMICGQSNIDHCKVDYGSALACENDQGQYEFAGIYTWDTGCKQEGQIAGFVKPDTDWIQTTLRKPIKELKRIEREYLRSH